MTTIIPPGSDDGGKIRKFSIPNQNGNNKLVSQSPETKNDLLKINPDSTISFQQPYSSTGAFITPSSSLSSDNMLSLGSIKSGYASNSAQSITKLPNSILSESLMPEASISPANISGIIPAGGISTTAYDLANGISIGSSFLNPHLTESETEKLDREQKEVNDKIMSDFETLKNSTATKKQIDDIKDQVQTELNKPREISPSDILKKLPEILLLMTKFNRHTDLDRLTNYFLSGKEFRWACGFGHEVTTVSSLKQLKQILADQSQGRYHKCAKHGHQCILLISDGYLFQVSMEDMNSGKIRGGKNKKVDKKH